MARVPVSRAGRIHLPSEYLSVYVWQGARSRRAGGRARVCVCVCVCRVGGESSLARALALRTSRFGTHPHATHHRRPGGGDPASEGALVVIQRLAEDVDAHDGEGPVLYGEGPVLYGAHGGQQRLMLARCHRRYRMAYARMAIAPCRTGGAGYYTLYFEW
eukprot:COSAG02_NODE_3157_length_7260_cov_20.933808_9_plen_160_part_00